MTGPVVVTGINGHVGNNLVRQLLKHGYEVRGTVRDKSKSPDLDVDLRIADVVTLEGWDEIMAGAVGLFHLATVYSTSGDAKVILETANKGTDIVLRAAAKAGIKRVIYTSSVAAIGTMPLGWKDESNWNENFSLPYTQAKTESERHAWKLAEELNLDLRVINPSGILGGSFSRSTPSVDIIGQAMAGKYPLAPKIPLAFVHVNDVATAHRLAFEIDEAHGRYILAPHNDTTIFDLLKKAKQLYPKEKFPNRSLPKWLMPMVIFQDWVGGLFTGKRMVTRALAKSFFVGDAKYSSKKAEDELGIKWTSIEKCIHDTVEAFK
ncbi:MAG: NAD-dependent epimerase/dehydratase family protein [Candidatus Poseidoniales archaeon]|jgi:nucleoside-diphosphate-sugar epimerase